jgi:hypothetical protein
MGCGCFCATIEVNHRPMGFWHCYPREMQGILVGLRPRSTTRTRSQHAPQHDSRLRRELIVRRIGTERNRVQHYYIACRGCVDIVSLTGFAARIGRVGLGWLHECARSMSVWLYCRRGNLQRYGIKWAQLLKYRPKTSKKWYTGRA